MSAPSRLYVTPLTPFDAGEAWTAVLPPTLTWLVTTPGAAHSVAQMLRALGLFWGSFSSSVAQVTVLRGSIAGAPRTVEGERHGVGAGRDVQEPELAVRVGLDGRAFAGAQELHLDPRQRGSLLVE